MHVNNQNPETRVSLLLRLRDESDEQDWASFVAVYTPIVFRYARWKGLQDADAADFAQEVLRSVARSIKNLDYDPAKGKFRSWLRTVCRTRLIDFLRKQERQLQGTGRSSTIAHLEQLASTAEQDDSDQWEEEYQQSLLQFAMQQVQSAVHSKTWDAFRLTSLESQPSDRVAQELRLSIGAVYTARSRVIAKLKKAIELIEEK